MAQRNSGYARIEANFYPTPSWVTRALIVHALNRNMDDRALNVWEPACGDGAMVDELKRLGYNAIGSDIRENPSRDFLWESTVLIRPYIDAIITNPPYGRDIVDPFVRKAIALMEPVQGLVAMLLRVDFDSASTRSDIFANHPAWRTKLVLTKRIKWFDNGNKNGPSENHAWFIWDWKNNGSRPTICYGQ